VLSGQYPFTWVKNSTASTFKAKLQPLDFQPLIMKSVSIEATALLAGMLSLDPSKRPTPNQCRKHRRFYEVIFEELASTKVSLFQTETERDEKGRLQEDTSSFLKLVSEMHRQLQSDSE